LARNPIDNSHKKPQKTKQKKIKNKRRAPRTTTTAGLPTRLRATCPLAPRIPAFYHPSRIPQPPPFTALPAIRALPDSRAI